MIMKKKKIEKIKFELIQIEKNYKENVSLFVKNRTLFVIGRHQQRKVIFFISDFFPRFFVEKEENIKHILENDEVSNKVKSIKSKKDGHEYNYRNLGGKKELITIYTYRTSDVVDIRDNFAKTYEANIKFTEVLKREKGIKNVFYVPKYVFEMKTRRFKINGIKYILLKQTEIDGGKLEF